MALQKADARTGTPVDLTVQDIQDIKSKLNLENIDNQSFSQIENTVNSISAGEGGVIYDTLAAAQAVSPKPSDGTIFQVSEITDSANAGFYSFQSSEANGTRFEKPFALTEAKNYADTKSLSKNNFNDISVDIQSNFYTVFNGSSSKLQFVSPFLLENEGDFIEFDFVINTVDSNKALSIMGEQQFNLSTIGFLDSVKPDLAVRSSLGNFLTPPGGLSSFEIEPNKEYKIKLEWKANNIAVYKDEVFIDNITKEKLIIENIGNSYAFFDGKIKALKINSNKILTPFLYEDAVQTDLDLEIDSNGFLNNTQSKNLNTIFSKAYYSFDPSGFNGDAIFYIYSQISNNYYGGFELARFLDLSDEIYSDQYRIIGAQLYKLSDGEMISQGQTLIASGESEFVYKSDGASDFTGGIHGDETIIDVEFYASGVRITNLSSAIQLTPCNDFYYAQKSNMHTTDDSNHPIESIHDKITTFTNGGYKTFNRITWLVSKNIYSYYHAISCIAKDTATEVHNEFLDRETFTGSQNYFLRLVGAREYYGNNTTTGLSSFATSRLLKPSSEDKNCEFYIWDRSNDSKMYRSFEPSVNVQINDVVESIMEVYFKVN